LCQIGVAEQEDGELIRLNSQFADQGRNLRVNKLISTSAAVKPSTDPVFP
jgi:hypothetical protein